MATLKCGKCGADVAETSGFCGVCGAAVGQNDAKGQTQFSQWWNSTAALLGRDPVVVMVVIGALLLCLGAFLPWVSNPHWADTLGLQTPGGPAILALGAILALCLVLSRGGTPGAWSVVIMVLSAVCLAILFQMMVYLDDHDADMGAGLYVAMAGGLVTGCGGLLEAMRILKK